MKRDRTIFCVFTISLVFASPALAQDFWMTRSFARWNEAEVDKMLTASPWAVGQKVRVQVPGRVNAVAGSVVSNVSLAPSISNSVDNASTAPAIDYTFTLRLRSAVPIRQAIVRRNALAFKESKKSELEQFEKRQKGLLECPACRDNYVLSLSAESSENKNFDPVYALFGTARLDDLKRYIVLKNEKGEKRELVFFTPPKIAGEEAVFFFPRLDETGNPLFTAENKELIFNITNNQVSLAANFKVEIAPMLIDGKVEF